MSLNPEYLNPEDVATETPANLLGTVIAVQANFYQVKLDHPLNQSLDHFLDQNSKVLKSAFLLCTRRALLKKIGQQVMVGDRVCVVEPDWQGGRGAIAAVLPRRSLLNRPPIANVDQILIVFALEDPSLDAFQLSRFLVKAETTGLQVQLALNKSDLVTPEIREDWRRRLESWGYEPKFLSVFQKTGLEELNLELSDRITVLAGLSGVGKSSLINYLIPEINLRVAAVSGKLQKGRHTTRHVELFDLPHGGLLADTPGFNQADVDCLPRDLIHYFPEARERLEQGECQFRDCSHLQEPNCVVRGDWERYTHYVQFFGEATIYAAQFNDQRQQESVMKSKTKRGKLGDEPKLEMKKYRQVSRRKQQQSLQDFCEEEKDD